MSKPDQIRIAAEKFKGQWSVSIGMYPANTPNFWYSLRLAEGTGKTFPEALANARQEWRDMKEDEALRTCKGCGKVSEDYQRCWACKRELV